jgi:hypothetical protein
MYNGQFQDNYRSGQGTLIFPDRKKIEGQFANDKLNGKGTVTYPDGKQAIAVQTDNNTFKITRDQ